MILGLSLFTLYASASLSHSVRTTTVATPTEVCTAITADAAEWLQRAKRAIGMDRANGVLHAASFTNRSLREQSDRTYPPYIASMSSDEIWLDPVSGVQRSGARNARNGIITSRDAVYNVADTTITPNAQFFPFVFPDRSLNPWATLSDFLAAPDARVKQSCMYREYPRIVVTRGTPRGDESLYIDAKTAFPVKLDRMEGHYLWGDVHAEYLYATWSQFAPGMNYPVASTRLLDGAVDTDITVRRPKFVPRDSAPSMPNASSLAAVPTPSARATRQYGNTELIADTAKIGENTYALKTAYYQEVVTLQRDTIFVLDATTGEHRAQQDSVWIGKLFPGTHPVAVVVTDLAWPHISGVRFWVASGATIISHPMSRAFLQEVVAHTWRLAPDRLEQKRKTARLRFRPVSDSMSLAGGALKLNAIDGIGSEGALIAYLPSEQLLWASDYIQSPRDPNLYGQEVWSAVQRAHFTPARVIAQHLPIMEWKKIDDIVRASAPPHF